MKNYAILLACCLLFLGGCGDSSSTTTNFYFVKDFQSALWKSDGTASGTQKVKAFQVAPTNVQQLGDKVLFVAENGASYSKGVWQSDGTTNGTFVLKGDFLEISNLITIDGNVYFLTVNISRPPELWKVNLLNHKATLLKTFASADIFTDLQRNGDNLMFSIQHNNNSDLWISDGTPNGTKIFSAAQNPVEFIEWAPSAVVGKIFIFKTIYSDSVPAEASIWLSDGTEAGTTLVKSVNGEGARVRLVADLTDKLLLDISVQGQSAFWGVDKATALVGQVWEYPTDMHSWPWHFTKVGRLGFFVVLRSDTAQSELWVTDGSAAGTQVLNVYADWGAELLSGADGRLFYMVWPPMQSKPQLWTSDGTVAGTSMVTDFTAEKFANSYLQTDELLHFDGTYFYFLIQDYVLWKTDGTEAGTELVKKLSAT